jgi:hypothetical protein
MPAPNRRRWRGEERSLCGPVPGSPLAQNGFAILERL